MVSLPKAIKNGFVNYFNFSGRSTRAEYWFWVLFLVIVTIITSAFDTALFGAHQVTDANGMTHTVNNHITNVFALIVFIPTLTLTIRRLRDAGRYWFWLLIGLIPLFGWLLLIVFYCSSSSQKGWGLPTSRKNPYHGNSLAKA